jgi:LPS-assembly protein
MISERFCGVKTSMWEKTQGAIIQDARREMRGGGGPLPDVWWLAGRGERGGGDGVVVRPLSIFTSRAVGFLIPAMLKPAAWLIPPLSLLLPAMLPGQVLPDQLEPPAVDLITPVPLPEIPFGSSAEMEPVMPKNLKLDNQGGRIERNADTGILSFGGPVKISGDNGLELFADRVVVDAKAATATLEGNVSVYQGNLLQRGDRAVYFYERKFLDATGLRASLDPILLESGKFTAEERNGKQVFVGRDAGITTHDVENPNFWVRADKTTIHPGDKIVFNDLRLYAGDTPVFWLPYLSQPLQAELGYRFVPGARSNWGPFILNTYGIMLGGETDPLTGENKDAWLLSRWHLDLRAKRGVGAGVDLVDTRAENSDEISGLSLYYINDLDPSENRSGVPRGFVNEDRYRVEFKHRQQLDFPDDADWRIDSNLTWLSDRHYLEDFDSALYRTDPQPDNTLGLFRRDDESLLSLNLRMRLNDFYRADTRLPEAAFDQARAPLFGLPVLHEGSTSMGLIGEKADDFTSRTIVNPLMNLTSADPQSQRLLNQLKGYERRLAESLVALPLGDPKRESIRTQLLDSSYARFHTYQEVSMPSTVAGFVSLTPQAGIGYTRYSAVEGPEDGLDRTWLHAGIEGAVKFSKDLGDYRDERWGLDGLLHVVQPYANWSLVSTNDFEAGDPGVDRLTPTTRPRPLDPVRFTAIDELQSWNVLRFGARNRLLTKRDGQSFEWLYLDSYMDAFFEDPEGQRTTSNLYNDVRWQPLPWMGVNLETQTPIVDGGSGFSEFNTRLHILPTDNFDFSFGYRWLDGHPVLVDSSRFDLQSYLRLTENWGVGTRHMLELDDGTLELQQYTIHRDLGNWVAGMGFTFRDNRLEDEYGMVFSLTLKDFPSVSLPFEIDTQ